MVSRAVQYRAPQYDVDASQQTYLVQKLRPVRDPRTMPKVVGGPDWSPAASRVGKAFRVAAPHGATVRAGPALDSVAKTAGPLLESAAKETGKALEYAIPELQKGFEASKPVLQQTANDLAPVAKQAADIVAPVLQQARSHRCSTGGVIVVAPVAPAVV